MAESATYSELLALQAYFRDALAQLQDGKVIRLEGIDGRVAAACLAVQQADAATQQKCMPELDRLIDMLRSYESNLRQLQSLIEQQMAATGQGDDVAR